MELIPPQPFKISVTQSQTANSSRVSLYTAEDRMAVVAGVVTGSRLKWSRQFMCRRPGLSTELQPEAPDNKHTQCHHMTESSVTD